jgi:Ca-activated chloride channel family protein
MYNRRSVSMKYNRWYLVTVIILVLAMGTGCASKAVKNNVAWETEKISQNGSESGNEEAGQSMYSAKPDSGSAETDTIYYEDNYEDEYYNYNSEEYNSVEETGFQKVFNRPLSTFSIDVDTASYSNVRRMINDGGWVEPDAVRIEELLNYFQYNYKMPEGNTPFSVNVEYSDCPWNDEAKLMLVGLQAKDVNMEKLPKSNLVFLLDVSGSMDEPDKLPLLIKAFTMLVAGLSESDRVSIVTYAGEEAVVLEGARGNETMKIISALENLEAGGGTAGSAGIEKAYELAEEYFIKGGNNRVILATDGDLNVGLTSEEELTGLIEEKRKAGVFLSVLGFGTGNIKDNNMEALADNGNGNYAYIDSELEAKKVLVEELGGTLFTVAKDVKIQVEFNPEEVESYRLIGYDNRRLEDQDFEDDLKDAGEVGAGHRVTALYEILPTDGEGTGSRSLKYQATSVLSSDEIATINLRYKEPDGDTSKLLTIPVSNEIYSSKMPDNLTFASSVAAFGMLLTESDYKGSADYNMVLTMLDRLDLKKDAYKEEFRLLVHKMKAY